MVDQIIHSVVILGSGRGVRRLDFTKSYPTALESVGADADVVDWILASLGGRAVGDVCFVGGYHIQKIIQRHPLLRYRFHAAWQREGELAALLLAAGAMKGNCLVCRSDIVFVPRALDRLLKAGGDLVCGSCPPRSACRVHDQPAIVYLRSGALATMLEAAARRVAADPAAGLDRWLDETESAGLRVSRVSLRGMAAPVQDRTSVARLLMDGKAHTLARMRPLVRSAVILDQIRFSVSEWQSDPEELIGRIGRSFHGRPVIVRSSAPSEDQWTGSQAGRFKSVLDVCAHDPLQVRHAIDAVVASLRTETAGTAAQDRVFVQEQVTDIRASGVLFSRHLETRAAYFVINIDTESRRTDVVTSGRAGRLTKIVVHRGADRSALEPDVRRLVEAACELESLTFHDALDMEFAFDHSDGLFLFQIRPLASQPEGNRYVIADQDLSEELQRVRDFVRQLMGPHATLDGRDTVLGVMPDWNPAEMLGDRKSVV